MQAALLLAVASSSPVQAPEGAEAKRPICAWLTVGVTQARFQLALSSQT